MSSLQPAVMKQCRSLTNDSALGHGHVDEDSLMMTSQLFLECLDRHEHHGRLHEAYKGIIRICLAEILANSQSEVAMWKDFPLMSPTLQPLQGQLPGQEHGLVSHEIVGDTNSTLREGTPLGKFFPNVSNFSTSGSVSYELTFQTSTPQHGMCFEEQILSAGSSTSHHQEPHLPVALPGGTQEKVKCTWPDCSKVVGKGSYTRHMNEMHLRKVKAICARCEKAFSRTYLKMNHEPICRGRPSRSRNS